MTTTPTNSDNIINSRDVIARIDELQMELTDAYEGQGGNLESFAAWLAETAENDDSPLQDGARELATLKALAAECEGYGDWSHGETLIRHDHFTDYAQELAEDIGAVNKDAAWPLSFINWEAAAHALEADYMTVDFDGVEYLMRA